MRFCHGFVAGLSEGLQVVKRISFSYPKGSKYSLFKDFGAFMGTTRHK